MFFKNFDFLSPNITLYFYKQKRHSSCIGGLLSIIMIIIFIYIIILYSFIKVYPNKSSLLLYRHYGNDINIYFNKSGLFHYIYIYNEKVLTNNINQNLTNLNTLKKGIIRIYMTYTNKYDFNSSNLKDSEHWVYDTCTSYSYEEDIIYDYSYSYCIKYYYNKDDKKYYSIFDNNNFKWPLVSQNITDFENTFFSTFIERCDNNSLLNEALGECYPENKIDEYLYYFNHIFISFINRKIEIEEKVPIKPYFHKIYDNIESDEFYIHDLTFNPFIYKETKGFFSKKNEYSSFFFNDIKTSRIYHSNNKKLIKTYIFHSKRYINEFIKTNNDIFRFLDDIGGSIFLIYLLFYGLNLIINERIQIRNFQLFLNEKNNDLIQRHINYEKNNFQSFKSNIYTNISKEIISKNDAYNSFKSTYLGNFLKNDLTNITNINELNNEDNQKKNITKNNYTIKINRIDDSQSIKGKNNNNNIIVINNNSFLNDNSKNKHILNGDSLEKKNSMKLINKYNKLQDSKEYHKTFTYNKPEKYPQIFNNLKTVLKNNEQNYINMNKKENIRNDSFDNNSKVKIIDTSSVSLLNKNKNIILSSINDSELKDTPISPINNIDKFPSPNFFSKINTKILDSSKVNISDKNNYFQNNFNKKEENIENKDNKGKKNSCIIFDNDRIKSRQSRINPKSEKNINDDSNRLKKAKYRKTNIFLKLPYKPQRRLSLFSKSSVNNDNSEKNNDKNNGKVSSRFGKSFIEQNNKIQPITNTNIVKKNINRQSLEFDTNTKNKKKCKTSIKNVSCQETKNDFNNNFIKAIQQYKLTKKIICNYICLFNNRENNIYMLKNFRQKLLSEEFLYIMQINIFIFKQKFGCRSHLEQPELLEELYNDL